ncbi:Protein aveugle [Schistosoma japonicum]|uniref:Protein aveugle n=1 Tax=Schistosoma japonicum TaxID=6182 RepID=A0A4Z2DPF8_SCHJA|nr:Protein aveugle [Schistosoma japonicum]
MLIYLIILRSQQKKSRHVLNWTPEDVVKWLHKYASPVGAKYSEIFEANSINGMCLRLMTDEWLLRLGIADQSDRSALMSHIYRMRLKYDSSDLSDMLKNN